MALKRKTLLCVGLDTDISRLPDGIDKSYEGMFDFNKRIVEITKDIVLCYKINAAFYEAYGSDGIRILEKTCNYIDKSNMPFIVDVKRGDIENTNKYYARFVFDILGAGATTLNPYMGIASLQPFIDYTDRGIFIIALTSNPTADTIQKLKLKNDLPLYKEVLKQIADYGSDNIGVVLGATKSDDIKDIRDFIGDMFVLSPGVFTQGGSPSVLFSLAYKPTRPNLIINSSRFIIYASNGRDFAEVSRRRVEEVNLSLRGIFDQPAFSTPF